MKKLIILFPLVILAGCTTIKSTTARTTTTTSTNITTSLVAHSLWDSNNSLAKAMNHNTITGSGTSLSGLEQSSSGSNSVSALQAIDSILSKVR